MTLEVNLSEKKQALVGGAYLIHRFTTDSLPQQDGLPRWREEFGRAIVHVEIEPVANEPFQAEATLGQVLDLRWMKFRARPCASIAHARWPLRAATISG